MMWDLDDLGGVADVAALAGVTDAAVANWRRRHAATFPRPIVTISRGTPVFSMREVEAWLRSNDKL